MTETNNLTSSRSFQGERSPEIYEVLDNCIGDDKDTQWQREQQKILLEEAMGIKRFHTIDSEELFEKQLQKRKYFVEGLLPEGLTLLSGDPKSGKSFFALGLSVSVAKGVPFLCFPTKKCDVLYFSFEDDEKRLQQRLFDISDDAFTGLTFSNEAVHLGDGFVETLEDYLQKHPDTKLIVVDTLNYIRPEKQNPNMYKSDYDDMIKLHKLTMKYEIAMLILHHNKKGDEADPLRLISGSMGIAGGSDNVIVIEKPKKKGDRVSTLHVVSRDMQNFDMKITQGENGVWISAEDKTITEKTISVEVQAVFLYFCLVNENKEPLIISATDLANDLKERFSVNVHANMITKKLIAEHEDLELLGLKFDLERKKKGRKLVFNRNENFRSPKYVHLYDDGSFFIEVFSPEEFEKLCDDSGDRMTAETDTENDSSTAVIADAEIDETIAKNSNEVTDSCFENSVSDTSENGSGDSSDAPVTVDSHCENSCQPVTVDNADHCEIVSEENDSSTSDDDYDQEDEFTHDPDAEKELDEFLKNVSDALVKKCAAQGITIPPFDPNKKIDRSAPEICEDNISTDTSETVSGDSSDDTVTADSRCENNCQPVNRCQPAAENNKKPVQNCGGNRKKHGKKNKNKKGGKKH